MNNTPNTNCLTLRLLHAAKGYKAVAFDIFDTLLKRDCAHPADLFALMEVTHQAALGFAGARVAAEAACHARGQKVYAVSDMYLPKEQIEAMLQKCGLDFLDGVFVSCEYGVQKRSGKLFKLFLQQTALRPAEVLFVGDSPRADFAGAALAGYTGGKACIPGAGYVPGAPGVPAAVPRRRNLLPESIPPKPFASPAAMPNE